MIASIESQDTDEKRPSVLIAEDHKITLKILSKWLEMSGYEVLCAQDGLEALSLYQKDGPSIIVTDLNMPHKNGLDLCREIRQVHDRDEVFLMVATAKDGPDELQRAIEAGADDFLTKPVDEHELIARVKQAESILRRHQSNKALAESDPLTGLMNRRAFDLQYERELVTAETLGLPISCMLIDLDYFKHVNDTYGHGAGDEALIAIANTMRATTRDSDHLCRFGGDEFAILLPGANERKATEIAERIRVAVSKIPFKCSGESVTLNVTIGVAERKQCPQPADQLISDADKVLLVAKTNGRNCVVQLGSLEDHERDVCILRSAATSVIHSESRQTTVNAEKNIPQTMAELAQKLNEIKISAEENRRSYPRASVTMAATAVPVDHQNNPQGLPFSVITRDVSNGGMGLIHTSPLNCGQRLNLDVQVEQRECIQVIGEVTRCHKVAEFYIIGICFVT